MSDSMFMQKIRGKIGPGASAEGMPKVEGGFSDIGGDANAASLGSESPREDYAVNVVNSPDGPVPAKGLR